MEVYCYDGPWAGQKHSRPDDEYDFRVSEFEDIKYLFKDCDEYVPPKTHDYGIHKFHQTSYRRAPKLGMVNLLFERKAYVACVNEPPTEIDPELLGDWELVEEADFVDDHQQWFAEKCYKYGMLTENEIW